MLSAVWVTTHSPAAHRLPASRGALGTPAFSTGHTTAPVTSVLFHPTVFGRPGPRPFPSGALRSPCLQEALSSSCLNATHPSGSPEISRALQEGSSNSPTGSQTPEPPSLPLPHGTYPLDTTVEAGGGAPASFHGPLTPTPGRTSSQRMCVE